LLGAVLTDADALNFRERAEKKRRRRPRRRYFLNFIGKSSDWFSLDFPLIEGRATVGEASKEERKGRRKKADKKTNGSCAKFAQYRNLGLGKTKSPATWRAA